MVDNEILSAVRLLLEGSYDSEARAAALQGCAGGASLWSRAAEQGWFALTAPVSADGFALPIGDLIPVFRLFGEELVVGPWLEQMLLPGLLLTAGAPNHAASRKLAGATVGDRRLALVDGGATNDWADLSGAPRRTGSALTGGSCLVRAGAEADLLVVIVEAERPAVALIEAGRPGVHRRPHESADPGTSVAEVRLDDVELAEGDVLAEGSSAQALIATLRSWVRVLAAAQLAGISRAMLDLTIDYVSQREQFGRPVASFQAVKHLAAEMAREVITLEALCDAVHADSDGPEGSDLELASLVLKQVASETGRDVTEKALQLHGGIGFTYEYVLHWYYKRALALRTYYGDERECAVEIGRLRLKEASEST